MDRRLLRLRPGLRLSDLHRHLEHSAPVITPDEGPRRRGRAGRRVQRRLPARVSRWRAVDRSHHGEDLRPGARSGRTVPPGPEGPVRRRGPWMSSLTVLEPGPLATIQDRGRAGQAALGVPASGACDRSAYELANRLVGNHPGAAALEVTFGGLVIHADVDLVVAITGAPCTGVPLNAPTTLRAGELLRFGPPRTGLRTYLAVRGGIDVPPVLGSRSTDLLSGLGPTPIAANQTLPV